MGDHESDTEAHELDTPAGVTWDKDFDIPDGEIVLVSNDGVHFTTRSSFLIKHSGFVSAMLAIPGLSETSKTTPVIPPSGITHSTDSRPLKRPRLEEESADSSNDITPNSAPKPTDRHSRPEITFDCSAKVVKEYMRLIHGSEVFEVAMSLTVREIRQLLAMCDRMDSDQWHGPLEEQVKGKAGKEPWETLVWASDYNDLHLAYRAVRYSISFSGRSNLPNNGRPRFSDLARLKDEWALQLASAVSVHRTRLDAEMSYFEEREAWKAVATDFAKPLLPAGDKMPHWMK